MAASGTRWKLAALINENCGAYFRSNLAQNTGVPTTQEDYSTQVSEEIEGRVTRSLSKEFGGTEIRILVLYPNLMSFFEPVKTGLLRIRSEDILERIWHKPAKEWERLPVWYSS